MSKAQITSVVTEYIEGIREGNSTKMAQCLHGDLAKRAYVPGVNNKPQLSHMSALNLIREVSMGAYDTDFAPEITVLDVYQGAASVRVKWDDWVDYMHIVKVGAGWKIINVLWELIPEAWKNGPPRGSDPSWPFGDPE